MALRIILALLGGAIGGLVGAVVGVFAGYGLAEFLGITSSETQAYFQMFVAFPLLGLAGALTGAASGAAIAPGGPRTAFLAVAGAGALILIGTCGIGVAWSSVARPAEFRVRNDTADALHQTFVGHDFRRATSLETVEPGTTTRFFEVDLDQPGSFNAVRARWRDRQIQLTLEPERQATLAEGRYTYVVREIDGAPALDLVPES